MNNPSNLCGATFSSCICVLPAEHAEPHECSPDPVCGGSWLSDDDHKDMVRIYRYPSNRPGCDKYELVKDFGVSDPEPGKYDLADV